MSFLSMKMHILFLLQLSWKAPVILDKLILPDTWFRWWMVLPVVFVAGLVVYVWICRLKRKVRDEKILNYFATSLYGRNSIDDIFWDIAKNCISKLQYKDCVIYRYDAERRVLCQKAAYGPKNPVKFEIFKPLEIPFGKGIVGSVAASGKGEIIRDTRKDSRYIVDDEERRSELTVPVIVDGELFGIIDTEHPSVNFYRKSDLNLLSQIATICAEKISKFLVQEKLRASIARDLHDEMGSTLTSIHIMSQLALQYADGNENVTAQLSRIRHEVGKVMESMSDIVWVINPMNDTIDKVVLRMKELASELFDPLHIEYHFQSDSTCDELQFDPEQRKDLFLIFKEALNNIAKYSRASLVTIGLKRYDHCLQLRITDNGIGFSDNGALKGNGLSNMKARTLRINGDISIKSIPGTGTTIVLDMPFPETAI